MTLLHIDFAPCTLRRTLRRVAPITWVASAIGAVLCAGVVLTGHNLLDQQRRHAVRLERIDAELNARRAAKPVSRKPTITDAQAAAVNGAIAQLNLPWQQLLDAVEGATPKTIALVSLEPDAKKSTVKGMAEAKTSDDMIAYIERLKQQPFFSAVILTRHEVNEQDPNKPLRFQYEAQWAEDTQ